MHVFIVSLDPGDLVSAQEGDATACLDHQTLKVLRLVFDILKQSAYLRSPVVLMLGAEPLLCVFDCVFESRVIERL